MTNKLYFITLIIHLVSFCICSIPSEWSLVQAKKHVIEDYTVVGTVDDYKGFLQVLEKLVPSLFNGLSAKYDLQIKGRGKYEASKIYWFDFGLFV